MIGFVHCKKSLCTPKHTWYNTTIENNQQLTNVIILEAAPEDQNHCCISCAYVLFHIGNDYIFHISSIHRGLVTSYLFAELGQRCIRQWFVVWRHQAIVELLETTSSGISFRDNFYLTFTLSQCTLAGPVYIGMPLECHWLIQSTLGYHWATQRILAGYTGTPLEKLSWNSPHWNATGQTLAFAAYTGTPLEGLWQPTHAPTHKV